MTAPRRRLSLAELLAIGACLAGALPLSSAAPARAAGAERFVVVEAGGAESLTRRLRDRAAEGYRLVGACHGVTLQGGDRVVALLEQSARPDAPFEYTALAVPGDLGRAGALDGVNELGALGYRLFQRNVFARPAIDWWLPTGEYEEQVTLILERAPEAAPHEYLALAYGAAASFHRELDEQIAAGYDVLGLWNTFRRPRLLLERKRDAPEPPLLAGAGSPYRLLVLSTRYGFKSALKRYGLEGYRIYDSTDQAIMAPPIVILRRAADHTDTIKFKLVKQPLEKIRKDKLEAKLNKRSRKGYRVLPRSITGGLLILERVGEREDAVRFEYRALSSKAAPGIPRGMEQLIDQGYRFVAMFHGSDETTVLLGRLREATDGDLEPSTAETRAGSAAPLGAGGIAEPLAAR